MSRCRSHRIDVLAAAVLAILVLAILVSCGGQERRPADTVEKTTVEQAAPTAADFSLKSYDGTDVALADLTQTGPAVLVFYRGHW